jgi:hypothetical protein
LSKKETLKNTSHFSKVLENKIQQVLEIKKTPIKFSKILNNKNKIQQSFLAKF